MLDTEKLDYLRKLLSPETPSEEELKTLLMVTKDAILNRRYPQGYDLAMKLPDQYIHIQLQACVQLYNKKGAEGQTAHSENGISRTYETGDISESLLNKVLPMAGSVILKAKV